MKFQHLLEIVTDEPVFETGLLLAGEVDPAGVRRQLSRWTQAGRLYQLRRGLYSLAPPYQKKKPHPFAIANRLARGSYVSLHSALAYYGLIPEYVPATTSVTTGRPGRRETALGDYLYRHVQPTLLYGYARIEVSPEQFAFLASPEKALLDLIYLEPGADTWPYLQELRLQNTEQLDLSKLGRLAARSGKPKLRRAAERLAEWVREHAPEYEEL
jgi:predicted transcriptional regulator of viral defense system